MKLSLSVSDFRAFGRNTLRGFCAVRVNELKLTIHDVAVHQHANGARWVSLPAKPMLDGDGVARRNAEGKIAYTPLFLFDSRGDAFSEAAVAALLEYDARSFDREAV